jgi:hypothetical protein
VTFRLADSFPHEPLAQWRDELALLPTQDATRERLRWREAYLDTGLGSAWLRDPRIAGLVQEALLHVDKSTLASRTTTGEGVGLAGTAA